MKVATHNGTFHADDLFAFAILRAALGDDAELVRSRDPAAWAEAGVVFDVGGIFDPATHRYDHHMRDKPLRADGAPFSSAGLVWADFGLKAVQALLQGTPEDIAEKVRLRVDQALVRDIDLMDNGAMTPTPGHFATVIEAFNPAFDEADRDENAAFLEATALATVVLARACRHALAAEFAAGTVAEAAARAEHPAILVLERRVPWEDAVFDLGLAEVLYVVRPAGADWTCSAVPPERGSFAQRLPLPDAWGGLRDAALASVSGVADATFCHPARFVCGARSREGAIALARRAVGV